MLRCAYREPLLLCCAFGTAAAAAAVDSSTAENTAGEPWKRALNKDRTTRGLNTNTPIERSVDVEGVADVLCSLLFQEADTRKGKHPHTSFRVTAPVKALALFFRLLSFPTHLILHAR